MAVFAPVALAAVNLNSYSYYEFTYNRTFQDYVVDLDGDGVNEKLSFSDGRDGYENPTRALNGFNAVFLRQNKRDRIILVDFDKSDKEKEILSIRDLGSFCSINLVQYRKSGKNEITNSYTEEEEHNAFNVRSKYHYLGKMIDFRIPGNGRLTWSTVVYSSKKKANKLYVVLQFKRVKAPKYYHLGEKYCFALDIAPTYRTTSQQKSIKAVSTLYVYKKASLKKNKLLFTLKKGKKYKPLIIKFGKKVTMIQIKAKGKKGWIFVPTKHMYF